MEAVRCSETLEQATFNTRCRNPKDHSRLNKIAASLKKSQLIKFSDSSFTCTSMPFMRAICPSHLIHIDLIIVERLREAYNLLRPLLCNFLPSQFVSHPASVEFSSNEIQNHTVISVIQHKVLLLWNPVLPMYKYMELQGEASGLEPYTSDSVRKHFFSSLCRIKETFIIIPLRVVKHKRKKEIK